MVRRREVVAGLGALAVLSGFPAPARARTAARELDLFRSGTNIGEKIVSVTANGSRLETRTDIAIAVRFLGLTAYEYTLAAQEVWEDGRLMSLQAETNDNGTAHFVTATRAGDSVQIEGSEFTGSVNGNPATTGYWTPAFLERSVWISTQDGRPMTITAANAGAETLQANGASVSAARWRIGGDLDGLDLFYDSRGEWVGTEFEASGERATFIARNPGTAVAPLWNGA